MALGWATLQELYDQYPPLLLEQQISTTGPSKQVFHAPFGIQIRYGTITATK